MPGGLGIRAASRSTHRRSYRGPRRALLEGATAHGGASEGTIMNNVPEVLFVCVHNAGRSQMAPALRSLRRGPSRCSVGREYPS